MKRFALALCIAVLAVCAAGAGYARFVNICDTLEGDARALSNAVGQTDAYKQAQTQLLTDWERHGPILDMLCPHGYTESLDLQIRLLPAKTDAAGEAETAAYLSELQALLSRLREAEKPSLQNIL